MPSERDKTAHIIFGNNLKYHRESLGYTQAFVTRELRESGLRMTFNGYSKMEAGNRRPTLTEIVRLSSILEVQIKDLFKGIE